MRAIAGNPAARVIDPDRRHAKRATTPPQTDKDTDDRAAEPLADRQTGRLTRVRNVVLRLAS